MLIFVCITAIVLSIASIYLCDQKAKQILAKDIVTLKEKKNIQITKIINYTITVLNIGNIFLPNSISKFFIPLLSIVIIAYFITSVIDEKIEASEEKSDEEVMAEFLEKRQKELKEQRMKAELERKK